MRLTARLALLLALAAGPALADCRGPSLLDDLSPAEAQALDAAAAAVPFGEGLLWRASRGEARLLLAGTLHLPDARHAALMAALGPAVDSADRVLVEATAAEQAAMAQGMIDQPELFFLTEGPTLPDLLGEEDWDRLSAVARERGMPAWTVAKFRPAFLAMTLSIPACAMAEAAATGRLMPGLDGMVMEAAEAAGVPLAPLEPWDTVFALLGSASLEEEVEALRASLSEAALNEAAMQATVDLYFEERVAAVMELWRLSAARLPEAEAEAAAAAIKAMEEGLIAQRNAAWISAIEAASVEAPRVVVAAGAAHLPGEGGVLRLLERAGWRIEPLAVATCCEGVWDRP